MILAVIVGFLVVVVMLLLLFQRALIYMPRAYEPYERKMGLPAGMKEIPSDTSDGRQIAFYLPPREPIKRLWVVFGGNAMRALDWLDFIEQCTDAEAGYLLVDYPGYGACEGRPSRRAINEASEAALRSLAKQLAVPVEQLEKEMNVLGLSIGNAAGLDFAVRHPVRRVVLVAPFTNLLDMARRSVGTPLCHLLYDRFDNQARLAELAARTSPPQVELFHGTDDEIIPFAMGKRLAESQPKMVRFHPVSGATHNTILDAARKEIVQTLCGR